MTVVALVAIAGLIAIVVMVLGLAYFGMDSDEPTAQWGPPLPKVYEGTTEFSARDIASPLDEKP